MYYTNQISKQNYLSLIPEEILRDNVRALIAKIKEALKPKEKELVSEWADKHRFLSPEDCEKAQQGDPKWSHDGFEYLKGFEDAFSDPLIRQISVMKSGQMAFTAAMINMMFYAIDNDPGPILVLYPTEKNATRFSKRKLDPAIRDTPKIREKMSDFKKKDGDNSTLEKTFPDGFVSLVSAQTVNNLSNQSIRYLFTDEKDRIPWIAGDEGDTVEIVVKRLTGFKSSSKQVDISTPTKKGSSRIDADYQASDQRKFYVPCPKCGHYQVLSFWQLKGWRVAEGVYEPEKTYYECENENCKAQLTELDKFWMRRNGEWRKTKPEVIDHAGFQINEMYSSLSTWEDLVKTFIKKKDDPNKLQTFFNLELGEVWEDVVTEAPSDDILMNRREEYDERNLPEGAYVVTSAGDVQKDRIELLVNAYGKAEESWFIEHQVFYGKTETMYAEDPENVWFRLENHLDKIYQSETGVRLRIGCCGIDARYATRFVIKFVQAMKKKGKSWIFALQGDKGQAGAPLLSRPTFKNSKIRVKQFTVGTFTGKKTIFTRLNIETYGPGYMHFNQACDKEFFDQIRGEKEVPVYEKGVQVRTKFIKTRARNEGLDLEVYCLAGLDYLNIQNWDAIEESFKAKSEQVKDLPEPDENVQEKRTEFQKPKPQPQVRVIRHKKNFVTGF